MASEFSSAKMVLKVMFLVMALGSLASFGDARQLVEKSKVGGENENRKKLVVFSEIKEKKDLGGVKTLPPFPKVPFVPPLPQVPQLPFPFPFPFPLPLPPSIPKLPFPFPPFPFPIPPISFPFPPSIPKLPIPLPPIIPPLPDSPLAPASE